MAIQIAVAGLRGVIRMFAALPKITSRQIAVDVMRGTAMRAKAAILTKVNGQLFKDATGNLARGIAASSIRVVTTGSLRTAQVVLDMPDPEFVPYAYALEFGMLRSIRRVGTRQGRVFVAPRSYIRSTVNEMMEGNEPSLQRLAFQNRLRAHIRRLTVAENFRIQRAGLVAFTRSPVGIAT